MMMNYRLSLTEWAALYRSKGFALARIVPGKYMPMDPQWTLRSREPGDFSEGDSIGIMTGRPSGDLVCVDIDCHQALADADRFRPPTEMVEGRPGKPHSHRWY